MDIDLEGMRDRRIAASDMRMDGDRHIFGAGTRPRRRVQRETGRFDLTTVPFDRDPSQISTIVLHQTGSGPRRALRDAAHDSNWRSYHRVDQIIAHFVVLTGGTVVYTHDVQYILNDAGGAAGIDIEMVGDFSTADVPPSERPTLEQLVSGRALVTRLVQQITSIHFIHPHGQVEAPVDGALQKTNTCCGPDFWVNIGEWAVRRHSLVADEAPGYRHNHGISAAQRNQAYRRAELAD